MAIFGICYLLFVTDIPPRLQSILELRKIHYSKNYYEGNIVTDGNDDYNQNNTILYQKNHRFIILSRVVVNRTSDPYWNNNFLECYLLLLLCLRLGFWFYFLLRPKLFSFWCFCCRFVTNNVQKHNWQLAILLCWVLDALLLFLMNYLYFGFCISNNFQCICANIQNELFCKYHNLV